MLRSEDSVSSLSFRLNRIRRRIWDPVRACPRLCSPRSSERSFGGPQLCGVGQETRTGPSGSGLARETGPPSGLVCLDRAEVRNGFNS